MLKLTKIYKDVLEEYRFALKMKTESAVPEYYKGEIEAFRIALEIMRKYK